MSEFLVPNIFVAGTKAKAYEVNENFNAIKEKLDNHTTSINKNTTNLTNLDNYVKEDLKSEFSNLITENKTKFCVNSGNFPLLSINGSDMSQLDFNIGGIYKTITATSANGESFTHETLNSFDCSSLSNGEYNVFIEPNSNDAIVLANTIYKQSNEPVIWQQPALTENGTVGGDEYACEASSSATNPVWYAFRNSSSTNEGWQAQGNDPQWITFYSPKAIKPSSVQFTNRIYTSGSNNKHAVKTGKIQGSNDNTSWVNLANISNSNNASGGVWDVNILTTNYYKYIRIYVTDHFDTSGGVWISNLKITGTTENSDDIWYDINNEPISAKKFVNGEWTESELVPIGKITIEDSTITTVETFPFNQNGYNLNINSMETYQNGTSWYRIYPDGWIEQGGRITNTTTLNTITLLKEMKDTNYSILITLCETDRNTNYSINVVGVSTNSFTCYMTSKTGGTQSSYWEVKGYIKE